MAAQLTCGAVSAVWNQPEGNNETLQPVLQVLDVRMVTNLKNPTNTDRFKMVLSDGAHSIHSMLATTLNWLVRDGRVKNGSVVQLREFTCSTIQKRRTIFIFELKMLQVECPLIGRLKLYQPSRNSPVSSTSRSMLLEQTSRDRAGAAR